MNKLPHFLALADGSVFYGVSCGAPVDTVGEAVFNTGMTGYQEIISDPSYAGQIVTLSTAEVGNYGCNQDDMESRQLFLNGLIVQNMNRASNFRSEEELSDMLKRYAKPALERVDTRRLVLHLREHGAQKAFIHASETKVTEAEAIAAAQAWEGLDNQDYTQRVTNPESYEWNTQGDFSVVSFDFGIKYNILRSMDAAGIRVRIVPSGTSAEEILKLKPDGVFLSNGPADPAAVKGAIESTKRLIGKVPLMGICLGHQIIGLACGAKTERLKFGHHGCNHPVKNLLNNTIEITSQNHNFTVVSESMPHELELTHINLNDNTVEGMRHRREPLFCVQYHPEAAPGPHDSHYLFQQFRELMSR